MSPEIKLPVTVILPTLDCRKKLEHHLNVSGEWLAQVAEIIAIDSHSSDGTWELLQEKLPRYGAKMLQGERGLYRSWNTAISKASQPHLYISTIGDLIDREGLSLLHACCVEQDLDVMLSTPRILNEDGTPSSILWPIHRLAGDFPTKGDPWMPCPSELLLLSCMLLPETILGSSASNLYRTELLQKNPFPEEYGSIGDVLWGIRHLSDLRVGISTRQPASFLWDGNRAPTWGQVHREMMVMHEFLKEKLTNMPEEQRLIMKIVQISAAAQCDCLRNLEVFDAWTRTLMDAGSAGFFKRHVNTGMLRRTLSKISRMIR